jgi:hypothetical protein
VVTGTRRSPSKPRVLPENACPKHVARDCITCWIKIRRAVTDPYCSLFLQVRHRGGAVFHRLEPLPIWRQPVERLRQMHQLVQGEGAVQHLRPLQIPCGELRNDSVASLPYLLHNGGMLQRGTAAAAALMHGGPWDGMATTPI